MNLTEPHAGSDLGALTHQGRAAGRRHLSHLRHQDLHHLRRPRADRQHHPPGAGAPARRAARHARHLAVPGAEVSRQRRRLARRTQRRRLRRPRAQARHPRQPDLRDEVRRERTAPIGYLVGEENRGLNIMFIMMNAARLAVGVQGVAMAERATQRAIAYAKERRQGRAGRGKRRRDEPDHRARRHPPQPA